MAYRSIKRVLGESSLELKCLLLFGVCLLGLIFSAFWWYGSQTNKLVHQHGEESEKLVYEQNPIKGRLLVGQAMYNEHFRNWETDELAAQLAHKLSENLTKEEYAYSFITSKSIHGIGGPREVEKEEEEKEFERKVANLFITTAPEAAPIPDTPAFVERPPSEESEEKEYQYYQPIYADASVCVTCHNSRGDTPLGSPPSGLALGGSQLTRGTPLSQGDLMAIAKITISNQRTQQALTASNQRRQEALNRNWAILWTTAIVAASLAMLGSYLIIRYVIVKPLRHLREVSDAVSHGNISLRADIHTGDEFESLAVAFNRMLRSLVTIQEELRHVNADLDGKVDELAQVNMRLYEMNAVKSDFLATMSHELRTPLNSILGFSDVLGSIDSLDEKQKRYVLNIQTSGRMLLEMINDILDLAKIESGKMEIRLTDFRLEQIISAQCDMARPLTEKKNIDLEARVQDDLPPMHQDQARVQQILNNLLSNAIKFTPEGGRLTVTAGRDGEDRLVMQVIDTGVGIAEEDQQAIFEKFRQGRKGVPSGDAMTREYSGSGLGLSIVKELCKLLGGEVSVESELGKGSTFTVRLPWKLQEQPRLDSLLVEGFEQFTKPRFELPRDRTHDVAEPEPQAAE